MIEAVLFDADGVLQTTQASFLDELRSLVSEKDGEDFLKDVFAAEQPALVGEADFAEVLQQVLVRWHVSTPVNEVLLLWNRVDVVPGMLPLANGLRSKGVVVGLATNQQQYRMNHMVGTVELEQYFDHSFYSCEIGATKPSAEYFSRVIGSLGLPPENVLLVDDSTGNIAGALASGLQGLQFEARMHVNPATTLREKLAVLHMIG